MCNLCKSVDHKANVCPFSWAREPTGTSPPREEEISFADPVLTDDVNDVNNHDNTDDDMDDDKEDDVNEEQLHATSDTDDVYVAAAGVSLPTLLHTDFSTDDISTEKMGETPQETVEESPLLFSVDNMEQDYYKFDDPKLWPETCEIDGN